MISFLDEFIRGSYVTFCPHMAMCELQACVVGSPAYM